MRRLFFAALLSGLFTTLAVLATYHTLPGAHLYAAVTGDSAKGRIEAYLAAIVRRDERGALALWHADSGRLRERRSAVTRGLMEAQLSAKWEYVALEWWSTCCMPSVIADGARAGGLRATLLLKDRDGAGITYVFDVLANDKWPLYEGLPARDWTLVDIYRPDEEPLAFRFTRDGPLLGR